MRLLINRKQWFELDPDKGEYISLLGFNERPGIKVSYVCCICKKEKRLVLAGNLNYTPYTRPVYNVALGELHIRNPAHSCIGLVVVNTEDSLALICNTPKCMEDYKFIPMGWL